MKKTLSGDAVEKRPPSGSRRKGRVIAVQALYGWELTQASLQEVLKFEWLDEPLSAEIQTFSSLLISGTIENIEELDQRIQSRLEHWDISRLARVERALLRMSVYTLLYQKDIPVGVVIDEAIDIAKEFCADDSYRFINGVLDAVRKEGGP